MFCLLPSWRLGVLAVINQEPETTNEKPSYHCTMRSRNVLFTLFFVLLLLAIFVVRRVREPGGRELFDRTPDRLEYTRHALCRMDCRQIPGKILLK